jgi:UDP-glucose 4-epimerase
MIVGKRILITGGAGLIGSHIADQLIGEQPAEIRVLDNFGRGRRENLAWAVANGPVTVIEGDIRDRALVRRSLDDVDVVFHQVDIRSKLCAEEPRLALEVLVEGTFNVLEAAVRAGVQKVVAASSASVYGLADEFPTAERHHPYNNCTLYGAVKAFDEGLLRSFNEMYDLPYVALRYFNVYGPRMDAHGSRTEVFIRWMERIANGEAPLIFGDGSQTLDFVHVHDVARANILAAKARVSDKVFNVASGKETSLTDVANLLARIMGASVVAQYGPERRTNTVPRRLGSTRRAKEQLGFEALVSLEQGLKSLVEWWRQESRRVEAA